VQHTETRKNNEGCGRMDKNDAKKREKNLGDTERDAQE